jgi:hypothetical protein
MSYCICAGNSFFEKLLIQTRTWFKMFFNTVNHCRSAHNVIRQQQCSEVNLWSIVLLYNSATAYFIFLGSGMLTNPSFFRCLWCIFVRATRGLNLQFNAANNKLAQHYTYSMVLYTLCIILFTCKWKLWTNPFHLTLQCQELCLCKYWYFVMELKSGNPTYRKRQ